MIHPKRSKPCSLYEISNGLMKLYIRVQILLEAGRHFPRVCSSPDDFALISSAFVLGLTSVLFFFQPMHQDKVLNPPQAS